MKKLLLVATLMVASCAVWAQIKQSVYAGPDQTILVGQVAHLEAKVINVPYVIWNTSGTGTFTARMSAISDYIPSRQDIRNGQVKLTIHNRRIPSMQSTLVLTIKKCTNRVNIALSADTVCGFDSGITYDVFATASGSRYYTQWTTDGTGIFFDEFSLNTTFEPSRSDIGSGRVWLKITLYDSTGLCPPVSDSMLLKLNDPARIDLPDEELYVCGDEPVYINGNLSGTATTVNWTTSGTGTFSSNPNSETTYIPSQQDRMSTYVTIYGRTNDPHGPCPARSDYFYISFYGPAVDAGDDIVICGRPWGGDIQLDAQIGNAGGDIYWTTNGNGGFDDPYISNPVYYYDGTDVNMAFIELYATVDNQSCPTYTDTVVVWLQAAPRLEFPQPYVSGCSTDPVYAEVYLYGHASSGTWTTTGSGKFDDPYSTYTAYYPSIEDGINGCVDLIFTSNDPSGPCGPTSGSMNACFYDCSEGRLQSVVIYPNPTSNTLQLKTSNALTDRISIKDNTGNNVAFKVIDAYTLDVSSLQPGIYTLQIVTGKQIETTKFFKQ